MSWKHEILEHTGTITQSLERRVFGGDGCSGTLESLERVLASLLPVSTSLDPFQERPLCCRVLSGERGRDSPSFQIFQAFVYLLATPVLVYSHPVDIKTVLILRILLLSRKV